MKKLILLSLSMLFLTLSANAQSKARSALEKAAKAMGLPLLQSLHYSGTGTSGIFGQNHSPHGEWPVLIVKTFSRTIDYGTMSYSEEMTRAYQSPPSRGGGAPFLKEQKQTTGIPGLPFVPDEMDDRHLQLLVTPHGFLKQAMANSATIVRSLKGGRYSVSFALGKFKFEGDINKLGLVEKVNTWTTNPVLGDVLIESLYSNYKDYKGIKFPSHIVQNMGGHMFFDLTLSGVEPNVKDIVPPAFPLALPAPDLQATSAPMSDGVWFISGSTHNSLLMEFNDYVVVLDAPNNEKRSRAVIAEIKKLVPSKPIRYVVNSHHHFDHAGGLRTYVADGATVITSEINIPFYVEAWKNPRTLAPDQLSLHPKEATFIGVGDHYTLTDGTHTLELYHNLGSNHNAGMLIGYLPKEKVLFVVDEYSPGRLIDGKLLPQAKVFANNLYLNLERLDLAIERVAPGHGTIVSFDEMASELGK